ncbi:MAG TPA: DNA polymerase III subunit [Pirellulales bacterium]|nr:DNA polymerase III subunit [Pirellulales bacterium]
MSWQGLLGHDAIVDHFRRMLRAERLASTFLFVGPGGIGKRTFARKLAQGLLCQTRPAAALDPCGTCPSCVQIEAGTHPDLVQVEKPSDRASIPVKLLIGEKEQRMREGFCYDLSKKPFFGGRKIGMIDDADYLNEEGANCLLKTLEEPPPNSVLILIGTSPTKQLPTIRSRCQVIRFRPLSAEQVAEVLLEQECVADRTQALQAAKFSEGSIARAKAFVDPALATFRLDFLAQLAEPQLDTVRISKQVLAFVDEAGKEAADRRERIRQVVKFALEFYRCLFREECGAAALADPELARLCTRVLHAGAAPDRTAERIERCLEALQQIDRNANQQTLVECWLDELEYGAAKPAAAL